MTYPFREDVTKPVRRKPKRSVQQAAKNKADVVFSKIVRNLGHCEHCGTGSNLQCAHWLSRRYSNTRTDFDNAFSLCAGCHAYFSADPIAWTDWTIGKRGREVYDRLREAANKHSEVDWPAELARLREIAKREGIAA